VVFPVDETVESLPQLKLPSKDDHHPLMLLALNATSAVEWEELQSKVSGELDSIGLSLSIYFCLCFRREFLHAIWQNPLAGSENILLCHDLRFPPPQQHPLHLVHNASYITYGNS
jgi:hypothetical protein